MTCLGRSAWLVSVLLSLAGPRLVSGQIAPLGPGGHFELDQTVGLERADAAVRTHLERAEALLDDQQWGEAVDTLQKVMEDPEGRLVGVTDRRFVSLRAYCHLQMAALPTEALTLYRSRVDATAEQWYRKGVADRDRQQLQNVLEQAFASSWGDDALFVLGEMALESGDHASARWYWQRIVPYRPPPQTPPTWPSFPDTDLDLAAVRARLVLISILEGSYDQARDELAQFTRLHGGVRGRLGGREVDYAEALGALLAASAAWPRPTPDSAWPTFAGSPQRNKAATHTVDPGGVAWRAALAGTDEETDAPSSYYPLLIGNLVLVNTQREILALDVLSGKQAWGDAGAAIYRDEYPVPASVAGRPSAALATPRHTMTARDGKLYARMAAAAVARPQDRPWATPPGCLVCLDLLAEGRLSWRTPPPPGWAWEGSPVCDGANLYVALRRDDVRPQTHVVCLDAQTGHRRWLRFVCGAETPARGRQSWYTHNLLTLCGDVLYYNTNLGAVAAISARHGRLLWVSLYPRARNVDFSKAAAHWRRDPSPCLYHHGRLLVAPADSPRIFAFDAATGQILWQSEPATEDATYLLGATQQHLIAGGDRLYWIDLDGETAGRVSHVWPDGNDRPGFGRGVLAAGDVFWPTREKIYVFDANTARPKKVFDLLPRGATGGNLLVGRGRLLIATAKELIALGQHVRRPPKPPEVLTATARQSVHESAVAWTPSADAPDPDKKR